MSFVISFKTSKFDVSKEDENPNNPYAGQSLLAWLRQELGEKVEISTPDTEDWGWYSDVKYNDRTYMIGASVMFEEGDDPTAELEWIFQIHKDRTLMEKLFGKEKMTATDDCYLLFKSTLEANPDFKSIELESAD